MSGTITSTGCSVELHGKYAVGDDREAVVDDEDLERVSASEWKAKPNASGKRTYAVRNSRADDGRWVLVRLHRFVLGIEPGDPVDVRFLNGDSLDCRRSNLVVSTRSETVRGAQQRKRFARCQHCGVRFAHWKAQGLPVYHSDACRLAARREKARAARAARSRLVVASCEHCGSAFKQQTAWQRFCSESCKQKSKWRRKRAGPPGEKTQAGNSRPDLSQDTGSSGASLPVSESVTCGFSE